MITFATKGREGECLLKSKVETTEAIRRISSNNNKKRARRKTRTKEKKKKEKKHKGEGKKVIFDSANKCQQNKIK